MGICISLGKNKNKNKKDELDKNIKMNLEDNNKQILDKISTFNDQTNIIDDPGQKEIKQEVDKNKNIINSDQNLISISRKYSKEKIKEKENSNNITDNDIIFTISDEFASNNPDSKRNIPYSPHIFEITNGRDRTNDNNTIYDNESMISNTQDLTCRTANITCLFCSEIFHSIREYEQHFNICKEKNNNDNNNENGNILISNSFNVNSNFHSLFRPGSNLALLLGLTEIDEQKEYINWKYNTEKKIWENKGKIYVTNDEINLIDKMSINEIKKENKFYKKRIWLQKKINNFMLDNTKNNKPLIISRKNILKETFNQFMSNQDLNFYRRIQINFVGEMAYDDGGVEREWYSELFKEIFSEKNNFFREIKEKSEAKGTYFIANQIEDSDDKNRDLYFSFIGRLFSKAILDKILIPYELNPIMLKYLLFSNYNDDNDEQEEIQNIYDINDIKYYDYEIYSSLQNILNTNFQENNNNEIYFIWNVNKKEIELIENGKNILLNNDNKNIFVNKVVELICFKSIKTELKSLKNGLIGVIPLNFIKIFSIEEFNFILSGQQEINLNDWKANTIYKGNINEKNEVIKFFWEVLSELTNEQLLLFYRFCTGSTRVPIDGFSSLPGPKNKIIKFSIEVRKNEDENKKPQKLIIAQTCFNSIIIPEYKTKEEMEKAINIILESDINYFGLE